MAFSRDDLTSYEAKPQTQDPKHDPWGVDKNKVLSFDADPIGEKAEALTESSTEDVTEPPVEGDDGSTTVNEAEPVAAEDANPEGVKDPDTSDLADGKPRNRAQERISDLVDERNAVKEYNKYLQTKLDELLRMQAGKTPASESSPTPAPQADSDEPAPTLESVGFDPVELNKKQNEWIQKQVAKQVKSAVNQIESRQTEVAIRQAFDTRTAEFRKGTPDFDVVLSNPALPQLAPEAARVVVRSESGPAIAYHLGKNPDLAVRIAKMDAEDQKAAIWRLEGQIVRISTEANDTKEPSKVAKPPVKVASVTKAPPPPKPVSGGTSPVQKDGNLMSMEEWVANERGRKVAERTAKQKMRQSMR